LCDTAWHAARFARNKSCSREARRLRRGGGRSGIVAQIVAFQGERGAYSEEAVVKFFGEIVPGKLDVLPCRSLPDVFKAINEGVATDGLIPIENSVAGASA